MAATSKTFAVFAKDHRTPGRVPCSAPVVWSGCSAHTSRAGSIMHRGRGRDDGVGNNPNNAGRKSRDEGNDRNEDLTRMVDDAVHHGARVGSHRLGGNPASRTDGRDLDSKPGFQSPRRRRAALHACRPDRLSRQTSPTEVTKRPKPKLGNPMKDIPPAEDTSGQRLGVPGAHMGR